MNDNTNNKTDKEYNKSIKALKRKLNKAEEQFILLQSRSQNVSSAYIEMYEDALQNKMFEMEIIQADIEEEETHRNADALKRNEYKNLQSDLKKGTVNVIGAGDLEAERKTEEGILDAEPLHIQAMRAIVKK